jgi:hypothetical protein
MGVEQTEIDALASLRPDLLRQIADAAVAPFYDKTLADRASSAYRNWQIEAQAAVDAAMDSEALQRIRAEATDRLGELREQIDAINDALRIEPGEVELPPIVVPTAELNGGGGLPLLDSGWSFADQCRRLIESKAYRTGGGA